MTEAPQLDPKPIPEVHLDRAPLARVLAQARFPPILAISKADEVASFQEALRETYPNLSRDQVHSIELAGGQTPNVQQGSDLAPRRRRDRARLARVARGGLRGARDLGL